MFKRRAGRVRIGIAGRNVVPIQFSRSVQKPGLHCRVNRQRHQQVRHRVAQGFPAQLLKNGLDRLFGALLGSKARPLVMAALDTPACQLYISLALVEPVLVPACHGTLFRIEMLPAI